MDTYFRTRHRCNRPGRRHSHRRRIQRRRRRDRRRSHHRRSRLIEVSMKGLRNIGVKDLAHHGRR